MCRVCRASCHVWEEAEDTITAIVPPWPLVYDLSLSAVTSYLLLILSVTGVTVPNDMVNTWLAAYRSGAVDESKGSA